MKIALSIEMKTNRAGFVETKTTKDGLKLIRKILASNAVAEFHQVLNGNGGGKGHGVRDSVVVLRNKY